MKAAAEIGILCRVATARMPTKWGMFDAAGFERAANGIAPIDTALALIMGDLRGKRRCCAFILSASPAKGWALYVVIVVTSYPWPCAPSPQKVADW